MQATNRGQFRPIASFQRKPSFFRTVKGRASWLLAKSSSPTTDAEAGASALDLAADIAGTNPDVKVDVVNVVAIPMLTDEQFISFASVLELMERDAKELLGKAVDHLDEIGLENEVETFMLNGTDPAIEISKLADQDSYDMVVIRKPRARRNQRLPRQRGA